MGDIDRHFILHDLSAKLHLKVQTDAVAVSDVKLIIQVLYMFLFW